MKMKKTQSLKLMLVGLLCSMGMSAFAGNGDVFTDKRLVLQEQGGAATVMGVLSTDNGVVVIPDKVTNYDEIEIPVVAISPDWYKTTSIVLKKDDEVVSEKSLPGLKNMTFHTLKIDASGLTDLGFPTECIQPLNGKIVNFEVTANCTKLTTIPDYAFANIPYKDVDNTVDQAEVERIQKEIADLTALSANGVKDVKNVPVVKDGKLNAGGKWYTFGDDQATAKSGLIPDDSFKGKTVFLRKTDTQGGAMPDNYPSWLVVDETKKDPTNENAFAAYIVDANGNMHPFGFVEWGTSSAYGEKPYLVKNFGTAEAPKVVGEPLTADPTQTTTVFGVESLKQIAEAEYMKLLQPKNDFDAMVEDVSVRIAHFDNYTSEPLKTAAVVLRALVQAERNMNDAKAEWDKGQLVVGENFWNGGNVSYIITNAVREVAPTMTREQVLAMEFSTQEDPTATPKRALRSEKLDGEDMSELDRVMRIVAKMAEAGFTQIEEGGVKKGYEKPSFQGLEQAKYDTQVAYLAALDMWNDVIAYDNGEPATKLDKDGKETPIQKIEISGNKASYSETEKAMGLTYAQLLAALNEALLAKNKATETYNDVVNSAVTLANLNTALTTAQAGTPNDPVLDYDNLKENPILKHVKIESAPAINTIGKYAFYWCSGAELDGTTAKLPTTLTTINQSAFQKAAKANPDFTTLVNLKKIGDLAFAESGATDGDFSGATGLKDFGGHVFDGCKIVNLMLKGTPLEAIPVNLAQGLYREKAKFVDACGKFHNYDITKDADKAELKALGFVTDQDLADFNGGELEVNTSLTIASLPEAIKVIEKASEGVTKGTYENCINLATLEGGVPATVETIGARAFYGTKIAAFDLTALDKLAFIGAQAFAGNAELTTVKLAAGAPLTAIPGNAFECDEDLAIIELNDDIDCLGENLFAGTAVEKLDLSKTQITVLPKLFGASEGKPNTTLKYLRLPEPEYDFLTGVQTRPGVEIILDEALAYLQNFVGWEYETNKPRFVIPSSVWAMRPGVFKGDKSLKEVYAMDSKLTNLGEETFYGCRSLEKFTFVTLNMIDPKWQVPFGSGTTYRHCDGTEIRIPRVQFNFDDMQFFECPNTEVIMTQESAYNIFGYTQETYPMEYSTVTVYQPTIKLSDFGGGAFSNVYFNTDYATWIKITDATVYTAYQDLNKVYIYRAKHQNGYYKIPVSETSGAEFGFINNADGTKTLGVKWSVDGTTSGSLTPYYAKDGFTVPEWGDNTNYIWAADDKRKPVESAAVIIVSDKQEIPYERHTKPLEIHQSTLDRDNELRITATGINLTDLNPVHAWHFNGVDDANFVRVNSGTAPAGVVVMKLSAYQGTAGNSRIEVVWVDDDATSIMGVKEYVKSLKDSDAIYNLQGVRVSATQKGQMYIQNGKKFIQK